MSHLSRELLEMIFLQSAIETGNLIETGEALKAGGFLVRGVHFSRSVSSRIEVQFCMN
jgi:hypothetical protein